MKVCSDCVFVNRLIYILDYSSSGNLIAFHDSQTQHKVCLCIQFPGGDWLVDFLQDLSIDLFVTGKWDENEDASALLKKDDAIRNNVSNGSLDEEDDGDSYTDDGHSDNADEEDEDMDEMDSEIGEDDEEEMEIGDDVDEEQYEDDSEMDRDDDDEEDDDQSENTEGKSKIKQKSDDLFEGLVPDTAALTDFQKKMIERDSKTKRQKKLEKKAKHKALFDNLYDQKQGGPGAASHFEKWKEANDEQEQKNKVVFEHLDKEDAYKITGLKPGSYVCILVKSMFNNFWQFVLRVSISLEAIYYRLRY